MRISIVTATYNRAPLLERLYESIKENQRITQDVEWLIMDDGSIDNTKALVATWQKKVSFPILYFRQTNQGKMKAINELIPKVTGDIIIEMDSDDYFMEGAFKRIVHDYQTEALDDYYGIIYSKQILGKEVQIDQSLNNQHMTLFKLHYCQGYTFDMALTFRSTIRKQYQYPLEEQERFITEARLYYQMDDATKGLCIKTDPIMICEYQEDGYSSKMKRLFLENPVGYFQFFKEALQRPVKKMLPKKRFYLIKHYILFSILTHKTIKESVADLPLMNCLLVLLFYLPGKYKSKKYQKE